MLYVDARERASTAGLSCSNRLLVMMACVCWVRGGCCQTWLLFLAGVRLLLWLLLFGWLRPLCCWVALLSSAFCCSTPLPLAAGLLLLSAVLAVCVCSLLWLASWCGIVFLQSLVLLQCSSCGVGSSSECWLLRVPGGDLFLCGFPV